MKATLTLMEMISQMTGKMNSRSYQELMEMVKQGSEIIFSDYPIYDETYRNVLNYKIVSHYISYQIGAETIPLFLFNLNRKMNEIMPYYNQLYKSVLEMQDINFGEGMDYYETMSQTGAKNGTVLESSESRTDGSDKTTGSDTTEKTYSENSSATMNQNRNGTNSGNDTRNESSNNDSHSKTTDSGSDNTTNNSHQTDDAWKKYSDTPQGGIQGVKDTTYLTNLSHDTNDTDIAGTVNTNRNGTSETDGNGNSSSNGTTTYDSSWDDETHQGNKSDKNSNGTDTVTHNTNVVRRNSEHGVTDRNENYQDTMDYVKHIYGIQNTTGVLDQLMKLRDAIMNVDMLIIRELETCFFGLW